MIHIITPSADYNKWLKRLNTQLNDPTNQNSLKYPKLLSQRIKKRFYQTLWTSVINNPFPLFLSLWSYSQFDSPKKEDRRREKDINPVKKCMPFETLKIDQVS